MKRITTIISLMTITLAYGQTWSDDVAQIFYDKCTKCHHSGGIAPFSLVNYSEAAPLSSIIQSAVSSEVMPPWPPDNNFQQYAHDRSLSPLEKTTVLDWILNGSQEGTPANTPPPPVYQTGSLLGAGDLELQIPTYMSKATASSDDYVCFAMPSGLPIDRKVKAIEIVPGNREILHHCLVYVDPTSACITDTVGGDCGGPSNPNANLVMGYTPGSSPMILPANPPLKLGMTIPANSQIVLTMHYPEGSYGQYDSTKVIFHFYPPGETGIREVYANPILVNTTFSLPPEQVTPVSAQYPASGGLPGNFSVLSVFPHMHLLGQSMKVYGIDPAMDTIKLIDIPQWDFEWQDFYFFKNIQKAPTGSVVYADAVFDNTSSNVNNPNSPPVTVNFGLNTSDEMFLVYMHYMLYQNGDENYNMDSLLSLNNLSLLEQNLVEGDLKIYPNPFTDEVNFYSKSFKSGDQVSITIYDQYGKRIRDLLHGEIIEEEELYLIWDGKNEEGEDVSQGLYLISINRNGTFTHERLIKH